MKIVFLFILLLAGNFSKLYAQETNLRIDSVATFDPIKKMDSLLAGSSVYSDPSGTEIIYYAKAELLPCPFTVANAIQDIQNERLNIVIRGGFTGFSEEDSSKSEKFKVKYGIDFIYIGCMRYYDPTDEDIEGYNQIIYEHLDTKFGKYWRKEFNAAFLNKTHL